MPITAWMGVGGDLSSLTYKQVYNSCLLISKGLGKRKEQAISENTSD